MNAGIISEYFRRDYVKAVRVRSQVANRFLYCSCAHTADKTGYIAFSIAKAIVCYDPNDQKKQPTIYPAFHIQTWSIVCLPIESRVKRIDNRSKTHGKIPCILIERNQYISG